MAKKTMSLDEARRRVKNMYGNSLKPFGDVPEDARLTDTVWLDYGRYSADHLEAIAVVMRADGAARTAEAAATATGCGCYDCSDINRRVSVEITCRKCGNKRCPHATDHEYACTNSNEFGQPGSRFQPNININVSDSEPAPGE